MDKLNINSYIGKESGAKVTHNDWNGVFGAIQSKVNEVIDDLENGGDTPVPADPSGVVSVNSKGNTIVSSAKHINIEPAYVEEGGEGTYGDIQMKPGDDITLESHHRTLNKRDEITVKTSNGLSGNSKAPVKLQFIASDITLSTKGKQVESGSNDSSNVMNVNVTTGSGKGYLKVRAQAIDLRCEEHGGIAIQPKGYDGSNHMNKIKFEHGGGDGLEFGTFNTEKTSIFTDEYRFKKDGVWKMATRTKVASDKADSADGTTAYKYVKAADDFYDNIDNADAVATTEQIIKTAHALNGTVGIKTDVTNKGNLEIEANAMWEAIEDEDLTYTTICVVSPNRDVKLNHTPFPTGAHTLKEILSCFGDEYVLIDKETAEISENSINKLDGIEIVFNVLSNFEEDGADWVRFTKVASPNINIKSDSKIKLSGELDFGSTFNFGETDNGIEVQYKLTKKNATKNCGMLKVIGVNNHAENNLIVDGQTILPGETELIDECSILDIIKFVNWAKQNNAGPWSV